MFKMLYMQRSIMLVALEFSAESPVSGTLSDAQIK
jgi:hypothetical protein